jgi:hypothetical protein
VPTKDHSKKQRMEAVVVVFQELEKAGKEELK